MESSPNIAAETLLQFLSDPASYPHRPGEVELLQTHISYVALAGSYVYKVKKPVDLGFADFSTLEKRRHFCEEEVRLNSRLCAPIYEGVVAIVRSGEGLAFAEDAKGDAAAEYAIKMRRLPEAQFLDRRLERGAAGAEDLGRVVKKLASFYGRQSASDEIAAWGRPERLRLSTDENFEQTRACIGTSLSRPAYDAIRGYTDDFLAGRATLLNRRRAGGYVVEGHGDLRLEHVHLTPPGSGAEHVCIYDCIEFSKRLRCVDVASDVAFLAMDLDFRDRPGLSRAFARQMADVLGDPELLQVLDFYKCYRAYVRGKVEHMRGEEDEMAEAEREKSRKRAARHFQGALQYAAAGSGPLVLVVMGRVGTGKSTQAETLGAALGWEVARSDRVRKEQAGVPLRTRGDEAERAALYAEERTQETYAALRGRALRRAEERQSTVLDATFGKRAQRDSLREALRAQSIPYCFVELTAPDSAVKERLRARGEAPPLSDARLEDFEALSAAYELPGALEEAYHFRVSTDADSEDATTEILRHLVRLTW